jgi:transposase-like protein
VWHAIELETIYDRSAREKHQVSKRADRFAAEDTRNARQIEINGVPGQLVKQVSVLYDEVDGRPRVRSAAASLHLTAQGNVTGEVQFEEHDGHRVIIAIYLRSSSAERPKGGVDYRTIRELALSDVQGQVDRAIATDERLGRIPSSLMEGLRTQPSKPRRDDLFYAQIAQEYTERRDSRSPVADLAREKNVSQPTMRDWLREARKRKLLESVGQGRAGGEVTAKAHRVLRDATK